MEIFTVLSANTRKTSTKSKIYFHIQTIQIREVSTMIDLPIYLLKPHLM